jgi:hypothetical protein
LILSITGTPAQTYITAKIAKRLDLIWWAALVWLSHHLFEITQPTMEISMTTISDRLAKFIEDIPITDINDQVQLAIATALVALNPDIAADSKRFAKEVQDSL